MGSAVVAAFVRMRGLVSRGNGQRSSFFMSSASLLSDTATVALAAVVFTEIYQTWDDLRPPAPFALASDMNFFGVKLSLIVLVTTLGAGIRFVVVPLLDARIVEHA